LAAEIDEAALQERLYQRWLARQDVVLRQHHAPGEKLFVDYAGQTVPVTDRYSGEVREAQILSSYEYMNYLQVVQVLVRTSNWIGQKILNSADSWQPVETRPLARSLSVAIHCSSRGTKERKSVFNRITKGIAIGLASASAVLTAHAQFDPGVMAKWASVVKIRYQVTGEYRATTMLAKDNLGAMGDVTDKVDLEFIWDAGEAKLVGDTKFTNYPSTVTNPHNFEKNCLAPKLIGPYEHFTLLSLSDGLGGYLHLESRRQSAEAEADGDCLGKLQHVNSSESTDTAQLAVPGAVLLGLPPGAGGPDMKPGPDKDSLVIVDGDWTWTYRLTPVE